VARVRMAPRKAKMAEVKAIREGKWDQVAPGLFPPDVPEPMIANFIDIAAQSTAEAIAPLPSFTCANPNMSTETARKAADKRTKIINYFLQHSRLGDQNIQWADRLNTYGVAAYLADIDADAKLPCVYVLDTYNSYYALDRRGKTVWFANCFRRTLQELAWEYGEYLEQWRELMSQRKRDVEVIAYYGADEDLIFVPEAKLVLKRLSNPLGRCRVVVSERPKLGEDPRGAYDDVVWVQMARTMMAQYTLKIAEDVANAPTVLPKDVQDFEVGPNAIFQTDNPQGAHKLDLSVPQHPFAELQNLGTELRLGTRHPEARDGEMDASIITGKGVQALMTGDTLRIKTLQGKGALALNDIAEMLFELDEKLWPSLQRSVFGLEAGAPFELKYTPAKDIAGNYTCSVNYGLTAGLDPNRALVFLLQLQTAGNLSQDTVMRQLPFELDVTSEQKKIAIEQVRQAILASVAAMPQALPAMAMQGGDPTGVLRQMTVLLSALQKGDSIEDAAAKAFAPAPPPPQASPLEQEAAAGGAAAPPENPMAALMGGGGAPPGGGDQASQMLQALAGTSPSGNPNLSLMSSIKKPV
ncbi:MAG TPA: hypothetical protein VIV12_20590, partial [Streptosporangiaceae bacterium]